jgi:hypothetical protein
VFQLARNLVMLAAGSYRKNRAADDTGGSGKKECPALVDVH